jgi:hypothetical protein
MDEQKNERGSDTSEQGAGGSSDSTPNEDIQAPQSQWFQKSSPSDTTPNEDVKAPESQWIDEEEE